MNKLKDKEIKIPLEILLDLSDFTKSDSLDNYCCKTDIVAQYDVKSKKLIIRFIDPND